jgi:phosphate transport system substrate-binding protein
MWRHHRANHAALAAVLVSLIGVTAASADVRIHGATTVSFGLIKPNKEKIERLSGVTITVLPSSTTRGLLDLAQGRADIAMLAEPLETAAESINKKEPGSIDVGDLASKHVGNAHVQFIINPANPLQALAKAQLADLFSGRVKNWSEVEGSNQQVILVGEPTSTPHRLIAEALGIAYSPDLRIVQNTNQTAMIVAQAPGALSYISTAHDLPERGKLKVVDSDVKLPLRLFLAYRKDAPEQVKKVVDAAASLGT